MVRIIGEGLVYLLIIRIVEYFHLIGRSDVQGSG